MSKLTASDRAKLPASTFAEPGKRAYPIPDRGHAVAAKSRATQAVNAGRMSKVQEKIIDRKANAMLGKGNAGRKK